MSHILLINPRPLNVEMLESVSIPYSILYLGTYLQANGHPVELIDGLAHSNVDEYENRVKAAAKDASVVGFSVMTIHTRDALQLSAKIKKWYPGKKIIWGGIHPTLFPQVVAEHPMIDFVIYGEGEHALLKFADQLKSETPDWSQVPGLSYKKDGKVVANRFGRTLSFDQLPRPDYSLLTPFDQYVEEKKADPFKYTDLYLRTSDIHAGRGCPYDCTFCINTIYDEPQLRSHRPMSAERIYEEMKWFKDNHGVQKVSLQDELFFLSKPRMERLIELLEANPLNMQWASNPRVNYFNNVYISEQTLKRLANVGYDNFALAVESGSDRVIKIFKKNIFRDQAIEAAKLVATEPRIQLSCGFIIGIPGEEIEDMYQTLTLGIEMHNAVNGDIFFIGPQVFRPYPGAELYNSCVKAGFVPPKTLEDWADMAINPAFGFLDPAGLPWLNKEKLSAINFIIKYFTLVLGSKLDRTILKLPARVIPLAIFLHLLLKLRIKTGQLNRFWIIERTILNTVTPFENALRNFKMALKRKSLRSRPPEMDTYRGFTRSEAAN